MRALARRFKRLDVDDLCQVGRLALVEAARSFDAGRGVQLWVYAWRFVLTAMVRFASNEIGHANLVDFDTLDDVPALGSPDIELEAREIVAVLSEDEREIVRRHIVDGESLRQIAADTGRSFRQTRKTYLRAMRRCAGAS